MRFREFLCFIYSLIGIVNLLPLLDSKRAHSPRHSSPPTDMTWFYSRAIYTYTCGVCTISFLFHLFLALGWEEAVEEDDTGTSGRQTDVQTSASQTGVQAGCMSGRSGGSSCSGSGTTV
jgi:hypothetical protein